MENIRSFLDHAGPVPTSAAEGPAAVVPCAGRPATCGREGDRFVVRVPLPGA